MTTPRTYERFLIRYSPRPLSLYQKGGIGPAMSGAINSQAAWNLAYLSHDYDNSMQHPDPQFTVHVRRTAQTRLNGGGPDLVEAEQQSKLFASFMALPAPRAVLLIKQHPVTRTLPLYQAYGEAWLRTIQERARLCRVDDLPDDTPADLSLANQFLRKFL